MGNCSSTRSRKAKQLDVIQKWRDSHSSSVRSSMIARKDGDIEDDYILHKDRVLGKGACGVVVTGERKSNQKKSYMRLKFVKKNSVTSVA